MATATSHLSLEDFERLYAGAKPAYEYWDGEAVQKAMPTGVHGLIQFVVMLLLHARGWKPASEVRLKLVSTAQPVPDVIASREGIASSYPTKPFELCIEILSPDDRLKNVITKGRRYIEWGIPYVWIIDPQTRTAWIMTHESPDPVWIHPDGSLTAGPETGIPLPELFSEVDKMVA